MLAKFFFSSKSMKNKQPFLDKSKQSLVLTDKTKVSHDTFKLRFDLPKGYNLGLPIGKHIKIYCPNNFERKLDAKWNGRDETESGDSIERKYTPISSEEDHYLELITKVYRPNERFSDGGRMSQYIDKLQVGDSMKICGPFGIHQYLEPGVFQSGPKRIGGIKHIGFLLAGSGLTPGFQIMQKILSNQLDNTKISLIYANQTENDILLRDELDLFEINHPNQVKVWHTVERPPENWKYSVGFVTKTMIEQNFPPPSEQVAVVLCGPPPFLQFACNPHLESIGYSKDRILTW